MTLFSHITQNTNPLKLQVKIVNTDIAYKSEAKILGVCNTENIKCDVAHGKRETS
jgi:hypothetical protein